MAVRTHTITDRLVPAGFYKFRVLEFTEEVNARRGTDQFKVKMRAVNAADGSRHTVMDWLDQDWKVTNFLVCTGHLKEGKSVVWDDAAMVGKFGFLEVVHNPGKGKDGGRVFDNKYYLDPDDPRIAILEEESVDLDPADLTPNTNGELTGKAFLDHLRARVKTDRQNGAEEVQFGLTQITARTEVA